MTNSSDRHVCVIYIEAARERVWEALTTPEFTRQYFHKTDIESDWTPGAPVTYYNQDRSVAVAGEVLEVDYPARLVFSWHVHYNPVAKEETPSRVTFELSDVDGATRLTVIHDGFEPGSVVYASISEGWIAILSNLKTLLETGHAMAVS